MAPGKFGGGDDKLALKEDPIHSTNVNSLGKQVMLASRNMPKRSDDDQRNTSLRVIQISVFLLVNFLLWGVAASIYNGGSGMGSARRSGSNVVIFVVSSVATLPEIGSVISYIWGNHKWYVAVFVVVETLLILFLFWMKKVDSDLKSGNPFRKRQQKK